MALDDAERKRRGSLSSQNWAKNNKEKVKAIQKKYKENAKERLAEYRANYVREKRDKMYLRARERYQEVREETIKKAIAYAKKNSHILSLKRAARKRRVKKATPIWANMAHVELFYKIARQDQIDTGIKMHVDHIIPLQHPLVCGLHNEHNLQILTGERNCSKGNKFDPMATYHCQ